MKFQLWLSADEMYDREQFPAEWASADRWRLPTEWLPALRERAHERGVAFGLSSFGFASLDEADKWVDFHKVASIEGQWMNFRDAVADKDKPILMSRGMSDWATSSYPFSRRANCYRWDTILLGCTVSYPCAIDEANLRSAVVPDYEERLPMQFNRVKDRPWGYSDHTTHPTIAPCAAVALGACVIEKHLRLMREQYGFGYTESLGITRAPKEIPDFGHALDYRQFTDMVEAIRLTESALGSSEKRVRPSEEPYLKYRRGPKGLRGS